MQALFGNSKIGLFLTIRRRRRTALKIQRLTGGALLRVPKPLILTRPTAADQAFLPLPRSLSFLHTLTHPIRILWQRILKRPGASQRPGDTPG